MEDKKTTPFMIEIPNHLHKAIKIHAAETGTTMKTVILEVLENNLGMADTNKTTIKRRRHGR
jgi:hypothetical protein